MSMAPSLLVGWLAGYSPDFVGARATSSDVEVHLVLSVLLLPHLITLRAEHLQCDLVQRFYVAAR
jgi:hypothetical protein